MVLAEGLRQAVLQAALQGKLTEQLETDSNVDELLVNIRSEREKLIAEKKIKKEKPLPEIQEEDIPFDIPDNWRWVRLGKLVQIKNGFTPKRTDESLWNPKEIPWFTVEDIHEQGIIIHQTAQAISKKALGKSINRLIPPHTVLLCCTSATTGRYAMTEIELTTNQQWNGLVIGEECRYVICSEYILVWVSSLKEKMTEIAKSTTFPFLSVDKLANFIIPLPPIEEQQRIVDKINEIMPKIDEYEKIEKELEALKKEFPTDMKDALLQAAMQGKLTEQLESDSSVDELLEAIGQEKEELIAQKKIKKEKALPDIKEEEVPFDIPENWRWEKVGNICDCGAGATPTRSDRRFYDDGTIFWLKTGELTDGYIYQCEEKITHLALEKCSLRLNKEGDILIAMYGATIGKLGIVTFPLTTNQACCGCSPYKGIYNLYLFYYFMSAKKVLIGKAEGGAQPNISREKIRNSLIPLPPIEEQQRIVERLEAMLPLCEELKE
jgi:type I restriction enzyme S subunit